MRLAWFSPLPPVRSGVAAYTAELLPHLDRDWLIDTYVERPTPGARVYGAHDFVWRHRLKPYDLIVYQLGNAPCHDYMWAYLAPYPGLVVLHNARLHHARARARLSRGDAEAYRAEFQFDHPDAAQDFTEYAVEGLGGPIYYFWSMLVGDGDDSDTIGRDFQNADRVRVTGYVDDDQIGAYLAASDVCVCLRWPTAQETSASWLRGLAAARPTIITSLAHLVDIPTLEPRAWRPTRPSHAPIAVSIDLLDEDTSLLAAMTRLAGDRMLREELGRAGYEHWAREHTLDVMAADYARVLRLALARSASTPADLPAHITGERSKNVVNW